MLLTNIYVDDRFLKVCDEDLWKSTLMTKIFIMCM